jgi:hypothetical protein
MIAGVRGRLVTASFARDGLPGLSGSAPAPAPVRHQLQAWSERCDGALGPASSVRAIADIAAIPLLRILGFDVIRRTDSDTDCSLLAAGGRNESTLIVLVAPWGEPLARAWRAAVLRAVATDARWCVCCNGRALRLVDGRRTWSREYLEFDLPSLGREPEAQTLFWSLARAEAMAGRPPVLDRAVELSARHGVEVCRALGAGVLEALQLLVGSVSSRTRHSPALLFEQSLTVLYRVLFLLFAEARGLVPVWHPIYRDRYSLDAIVSMLLSGREYRGLWLAIRAISRLAHAGCRADELKVTAFNGRLFSPEYAAAFDRTPIADTVMSRAVVAVSTTPVTRRGVRARIVYRDLDVEQLGAVYEQVLEYEPAPGDAPAALTKTSDVRKSSGTFYTPRTVTSYLVRRTLEPLVRGRCADDILKLRIVDPAMGSGAFLVGACRYLASATEDALVQEGRWHAHDITAADRASLRRQIASRCLFGVDLNPMAVQLARLSLWLATLASDKPLSFLDHHLVAGDSLIGATPDDVRRQPSHGGRRSRRHESLPLFEEDALAATLEDAVRIRLTLALDPDDSVAIVRAKEQTLAALQSRDASLGRWSQVMDLWCAGWFWENGAPPARGAFGELVGRILHRRSALPDRMAAPLMAEADAVALRRRFLHWPLAFPEVFAGERGRPLPNPGFDAVIGNPPWDMIRGDSGEGGMRVGRRLDARQVTDFVRESGVYRVASRAHMNRYQLFVERALQLARRGGRIGFVLPSGVASDTGTAPLRRHLFDRAEVDELTGLDNREGIFPIHRGLRFVLLTCTAGRSTTAIRCRFGVTHTEDLERVAPGAPVVLTRSFLARLSGADDLGVPELTSPWALRLVERLGATVPRLGSVEGWHVQFGRELNATDDRCAFSRFTGRPDARPVVEGKLIDPFRVSVERCRLELRAGARVRVQVPRRARLAYRDVASATNRLTLIAAIVPPRAVTTHTLFCLKTPLPPADQHVLCALLNSVVANYLIRLRVNTHVTVSLVSRLPVPLVGAGHPLFDRLASLSRRLTEATLPVEGMSEYAELQALAARLYGLDTADFEHVLSTFPLIDPGVRQEVLTSFINLR